ncbi:hypothetical protein, partial [Lactobacillus crispatus]|uniref:hypothetical protein n=1 Tax=Lactobacillus crispatus TaxID=47770 RepID=UPI0013F46F14
KKPTAVTFMVNYTYEKNRLNGNIPDSTTWYNEQKANIKKICDNCNMAAVTRFHNADFKRTPDHSDYLRSSDGQLIAEDDHYHAILVDLSGRQARLKTWAKLLEGNGIHISKVNEDHQTLSNLQGLSTKRETFESALAYLVHATPRARKDGKHQYKTVDFVNCEQLFGVTTPKEVAREYEKIVETQKKIQIKFSDDDFVEFYRKQREEIDTGADILTLQNEYKHEFAGQYADYERNYLLDLQKARVRYLQELSKQVAFYDRKFSYVQIFGHGGIGKSRLASILAGFLSGDSVHIHQAGTPGKKKTPDLVSTYQDELVTVAHELKSSTFSTATFESFMDPHVYPTVNSRNKDKAYFAQNFINANSTPPHDWTYEMFYWDLLAQDKAGVNFSYKAELNGQGMNYKPFPKVYSELLEEDSDFFEKRWSREGQQRFLDEWWQVLRRITFIIHLEKQADGLLVAKIYKFYAGTMPRGLQQISFLDKKGKQFKKDFDFWAHFTELEEIDFDSSKEKYVDFARKIFKALVNFGITVPQKLPKLLTTDELKKKIGIN